MANMNLNRPGYSGGSDFTGMITDSGSACGDYAGWPKHLARQPLGVPQRDDLARSYYARSSSWATVSEPHASRLDKYRVDFSVGNRAVLDATRDDEELTRSERHVAIAHLDRELPVGDEE